MSKRTDTLKRSPRAKLQIRWRRFLKRMDERLEKFERELEFLYEPFCPTCHEPAQDKGDWYHCPKCGHAVGPVTRDGVPLCTDL